MQGNVWTWSAYMSDEVEIQLRSRWLRFFVYTFLCMTLWVFAWPSCITGCSFQRLAFEASVIPMSWGLLAFILYRRKNIKERLVAWIAVIVAICVYSAELNANLGFLIAKWLAS